MTADDLRKDFFSASENKEFDTYRATAQSALAVFGDFSDEVEFIKGNEQKTESKPGLITASSVVNDLPIAYVKETTREEAVAISQKAHKAQNILGAMPIELRQKLCEEIGKKLKLRNDDLALLLSHDVGKSVFDAKTEVKKSLKEIEWSREGEVKNSFAPKKATMSGKETGQFIVRRPKGVVLNIVGYNYPIALSLPGIIGSIISGNTVILGPTTNAMISNLAFRNTLQEAVNDWLKDDEVSEWLKQTGASAETLKNGTIGMVFGYPARGAINPYFREHSPDRTDHLFFVGGTEQGLAFRKEAGAENCTLELGGNPAITVMSSYLRDNPDKLKNPAFDVARDLVKSATDNVDQRCTGLRRLFVQKSPEGDALINELERIYARIEADNKFYFKDEEKGWVEKTLVGNPFDENVIIGPLAKDSAIKEMLGDPERNKIGILKQAEEAGAKVIGGQLKGNNEVNGSLYVTPALVVWDTESQLNEFEKNFQQIAGHEVFAPILHVVKGVKTLNEAINLTNSSEEILIAGIYTNDDADYKTFMNGIKIGDLDSPTIVRNSTMSAPNPAASHGGRIGGPDWAVDHFTRKQTVAGTELLVNEALAVPSPAMPLAA